MLWIITDFSRYKTLKQAEEHLSFWLEKKITKITFRNTKKFLDIEVENLAQKLSKKYSFAEIFLRTNLKNHEKTGFLHLKSTEFDKIQLYKAQNLTIAISTHSEREIKTAFQKGADFAFVSPIYTPISKPKDKRKTIKPIKQKNLFLLGGLTFEKIEQLKQEGFENFAGISLFYQNLTNSQ